MFPANVRPSPVATALLCILFNLFVFLLFVFYSLLVPYICITAHQNIALWHYYCPELIRKPLKSWRDSNNIFWFSFAQHRLRRHLEAAQRWHRAEERGDGHRAEEHEGASCVQGRRPSAGRPDAVAADDICSCGVLWVTCNVNASHLHLILLFRLISSEVSSTWQSTEREPQEGQRFYSSV